MKRYLNGQASRILLFALVILSQSAAAQSFFDFTRAIPEHDANGNPLPGANTTFADGSVFIPDGDVARSHKWAWRALGDRGVLSSLGPTSSTLPHSTKELVTTVKGLKPGSSYAVQALFWSDDTARWGVRAGLVYAQGLRTNTWFDNQSTNVMEAGWLPWSEQMPSTFTGGGRFLYAAYIGTAVADTNGDLKVYIHDLPSADSNKRVWYNGVAVSEVDLTARVDVNFASAGTRFSRGVRGLALADITMDRGEYHVGIPKVLQVARGGSIRGVATGLAAEIYDWRTRNGQPRPPTLQFLRYSRDYDAELYLGANLRGLIELNPEGGWRYYDTNISTISALAGDWVRYVNHIVPGYRQGDPINDARDAAILDSLTWSSSFPGDNFSKLLAPGEPAVPKIKYWEIGNEPTYGVRAYSVSNSFTLNSNDFYLRYKAVAEAIKAEDPTVKVGPTMSYASRETEHLLAILSDHTLPIEFITYHPYERMGTNDDPVKLTRHLNSVHTRQMQFYHEIRNIVIESGRNADAIEYAATEVNVSSWDTNDTDKEARIAHALGTVETIFSHARLGLAASMYWIWPAHRWDGTEYPVFKAYEKLRDHMGDTLLSIYARPDVRVYTTRDSRTGEISIWALNFSNESAATVNLDFDNLPRVGKATLLRLVDKTGPTTLLSANLSSDMPGGPAMRVDWTASDLTGTDLGNYSLNLPAATLSLLVLEPGLRELTPILVDHEGAKRFTVQFQPIPHAASVRYQLFRSDDLVTWQAAAEAGAGNGNTITLIDPQPVTNSAPRFFRVGVVRN